MSTRSTGYPSAIAVDAQRVRVAERRFALLIGLFALSGATALIDQVCFAKYLGYVVGSTAYAVSAVLAAFMAGLALGAHVGGRLSARIARPLFAYGWLELVVAVAVAAAPAAFGLITPLYVQLARSMPDSLLAVSALRWGVAAIVVIVPTTAMGATLPLLARATSFGLGDDSANSKAKRERRLTWLYAANTLGAALGALSAAYAILPALGLSRTLLASAALSALVGVVAIFLGKTYRSASEPREAPAAARSGDEAEANPSALAAESSDTLLSRPQDTEGLRPGLLALIAAASGALVFASEVIATHLLALIIGNSAYSFGLILAIFLSCLFLGALLAPRLRTRLGGYALPFTLLLTALALALALPLWDLLPLLFGKAGGLLQTFAAREGLRAVAAFAVLVVPTSLMGLTFPLLLAEIAGREAVGRFVGRLTAVNTMGAVVGSLVTGYLVLPAIGSEGSLRAVGFAYAALGIATLIATKRTQSAKAPARGGGRRFAMVLAAASASALVLVPRFDLARLTSGSNVYFTEGEEPDEILFVREDVHGGVTTVTRDQGVLTLLTNGKFQGNTGWEMRAQRLFAHYPSLFVNRFDRALVIGLGTGTTLGTLTAYPWKQVDVVEISPSIVEAARLHFGHVNRGALDDRRVALHHQDGRNFLLVSDERYDLIGMELSSIWFAGAAALYSDEYYALVSDHLRPGGIFQQWVQLHHIYRHDFATVLATLRRHFRHVALFYGGGQGILVASQAPLRAVEQRLEALEQRPSLRALLPTDVRLVSLLDDILLIDEGLDRFLARAHGKHAARGIPAVSTDDNLYLEYATPRGNVLPWSSRDALVAELRRFHDDEAVAELLVRSASN
jgi:spermidine synthase